MKLITLFFLCLMAALSGKGQIDTFGLSLIRAEQAANPKGCEPIFWEGPGSCNCYIGCPTLWNYADDIPPKPPAPKKQPPSDHDRIAALEKRVAFLTRDLVETHRRLDSLLAAVK